jgi:hypothetical protein
MSCNIHFLTYMQAASGIAIWYLMDHSVCSLVVCFVRLEVRCLYIVTARPVTETQCIG